MKISLEKEFVLQSSSFVIQGLPESLFCSRGCGGPGWDACSGKPQWLMAAEEGR